MTREEAIDFLKAGYPDSFYELLREAFDMAIEALEQPEIIFCNECKHSFMGGGIMGCAYHTKMVAPHWFCFWARRRKECQPKDDNSHPFADDVMMEVEQ